MKKGFVKLLLVLAILSPLALAIPAIVHGAGTVQEGLDSIQKSFPTGTKESSVESVTKTVITAMLYFAGIASVLVIIIGGLMSITAGGDETKAKKGKQAVYNAVIGLVITVFAYIIVQVIYNFITSPTT